VGKRRGVVVTLAALIAVGETLAVEFKSDVNDTELVETVVCLANAEGGTLLVGGPRPEEEEMIANGAVMHASISTCASYERANVDVRLQLFQWLPVVGAHHAVQRTLPAADVVREPIEQRAKERQ
jgi:hypothetical protein